MILNDTLEEELRVLICEQNKEINYLKQNIVLLKRMVAEESQAKYTAWALAADQYENDKTNV